MTLTTPGDAAVATDHVAPGAPGPKAPATMPARPPAGAHTVDPTSGSERITSAYGLAEAYGEHSVRSLTLREYGREVLELSDEQAGSLNRVGDGQYLSVEPGEQPGYRQVAARNYVGSVNVAGLQVLVRPKIPLRNLFLLLEIGLPEQHWDDVLYETNSDLLPALVSSFARTTKTTLARGLYHSYREQRDRLVALRGRVDIARQFAQPGVVIPTACRFTEFTADLIENSYLKAAVSRCLRVAGVLPIDRRRLMQHLVTLEDVGDVPHHHTDSGRVVFTRLNEHYKPALRLAELVLANLTLQDRIGETQASSFMLDMNKLFERFVTERLRNALRGRLTLKSPHPDRLDYGGHVAIRPDLLFVRGGAPKFVADIKYKLTDDTAAGRSADYYQLLAYTTALDLPEGVLIYCLDANRPDDPSSTLHTDDPLAPYPHHADRGSMAAALPLDAASSSASEAIEAVCGTDTARVRSIRVRHADKVLHTYALDLSGTAEDVAQNLRELADWITDKA